MVEVVAPGLVRYEDLEPSAVGYRHDQVQRGEVVQRVIGGEHVTAEMERLSQMGDLEHPGDAALEDDVAAEEIRGPLDDPGRQRGQAPASDLGRHDWDAQLLLEADVAVPVL